MIGAARSAALLDCCIGSGTLDIIPAWAKAAATLDAICLIQLGARAGFVAQITGIDKASANRLYRQIHGRPSPPGQAPFTDHWFLKNDRRMLHAALIWPLHLGLKHREVSPARRLINLYEVYRLSVSKPLLDITHAAFVPSLVDMGLWHERRCHDCRAPDILPVGDHDTLCPGCRLYQRYRCPACGVRAEGMRKGRRPKQCAHCGRARTQ